jgi:hypothetical protein
MTTCLICGGPIEGPRLTTDDGALHPSCLAERLPHDAALALLAAVGFVLVHTAVVWAG